MFFDDTQLKQAALGHSPLFRTNCRRHRVFVDLQLLRNNFCTQLRDDHVGLQAYFSTFQSTHNRHPYAFPDSLLFQRQHEALTSPELWQIPIQSSPSSTP